MLKERFSHAFQFLACYFYQGFSAEFEAPEAAVEKFIEESQAAVRHVVVKELRQIIATESDQELTNIIFTLGCYYDPLAHRGIAMRKWLDQVTDQLQLSLEGSPNNRA
jgi:hypothetical protein